MKSDISSTQDNRAVVPALRGQQAFGCVVGAGLGPGRSGSMTCLLLVAAVLVVVLAQLFREVSRFHPLLPEWLPHTRVCTGSDRIM